MNEFLKKIDEQIAFNHGKNLFVEENELALKFFGDTISSFSNINEIDSEKESILIDYVAEKAIEEFCKINQYYSFNSRAKDDLKNIYRNLLCSFRSDKNDIKTIEKTHYLNLKNWLNQTNPYAEKVYSKKRF
ncbi:MAG: hypothetical protein JXR36_11635 [Bacteroidales bacterium]|nr:hypothetical protein [Bacteroidales bacterium]